MLDFTDQARVVLYDKIDPVKELKFNVKESDNEHWFEFDRLTENPWSDMDKQSLKVFDIEEEYKRSFIISNRYGGCPNEVGWMMITGHKCPWERKYGRDVVLYSTVDSRTNWSTDSKLL